MKRLSFLFVLLLLSLPCYAGQGMGPGPGWGVGAAVLSAPTYVQTNNAYTSNGPATLSGVTAGHLLVVVISGNSTSSMSLSGGCSSSWIGLTDASQTGVRAQAFYCDNATGGSTSVTITGFPGDCGWGILEYTAGTLDTEQAQTQTGSNPTSGNITSSTSVLLVGWLADENNASAPTTSWTNRVAQTNHYLWVYDTAGSAGSNAFNPTRGVANTVVGVAGFKGK